MEIFGQDFGRIFLIGQGMAYAAFVFVFVGISHLILLLINRLELVLVNSMSSDLVSRAHEKSRTQIARDVDNLATTQAQRDAHLINVITKMLVITITIIIISIGTAIITGARYYFADRRTLAQYLSLARWAWFTMINISFGAFCIYLTIGFNYDLYRWWCRCDGSVHKCILCCIKRSTVRRITRVSISQSTAKLDDTPVSRNSITATNTRRNTGMGAAALKLQMASIPSSSPDPQGMTSTSDVSHKRTITPQTTNTITNNMMKDMPTNGKMASYSSMASGLDADAAVDCIEEHIQTQSTVHINGVPTQKSIEEGPEEEERVYDLTLKMSGLANQVELTGLKSGADKGISSSHHETQNTTDSVSFNGYTANGIMHMASEQL